MRKSSVNSTPIAADFTKARIGLVVSLYNRDLSDALLFGCKKALLKQGVVDGHIAVVYVSGAFEIPFMCRKLMKRRKFDVLIALGVVIKGETDHYEYVCSGVVHGLSMLNSLGEIPVIFEVLMVRNVKHARSRCSRSDMRLNKGYEAAFAALNMIESIGKIGYTSGV